MPPIKRGGGRGRRPARIYTAANITPPVSNPDPIADIQFIGWSLLFTSNGHTSLPNGVAYGQVHNLLGEIYAADGYTYNSATGSHKYEPATGMDNLNEAGSLSFITGLAGDAVLMSGHTQDSGLDPTTPPAWYNDAEAAADTIIADGKEILWYQGWMYRADSDTEWDRVPVNFQNMKTSKGGTVIKTSECLRYLYGLYPEYWNTTGVGFSNPPVDELWADTVHGTFAMYYLAAMCIYKALTGNTVANTSYTVPAWFQMPQTFIDRIHYAVDVVQDEFYPGITGTNTNALPIINDQTTTAVQSVDKVLTLGDLTDFDGDTVTYSIISGTGGSISTNQLTFNSATLGLHTLVIEADDGEGGTAQATMSITVNAAATLEVWVSFHTDQSIASPASQTVNYLNTSSITTTATDLLDVDGVATTIDMSWSEMVSGSTPEAASGTDQGFLPDVLMGGTTYSSHSQSAPNTITISGLTANTSYEIKYTASRAGGTGRNQYVTIGDGTNNYTLEAGGNRNSGITSTYTSNSSGEIVITAGAADTGGNTFLYLTGMTITEV